MRDNHPLCRPIACAACALATLLIPCCSAALAQNLYSQPTPPPPAAAPTPSNAPSPAPGVSPTQNPNDAASANTQVSPARTASSTPVSDQLSGLSLFSVSPPVPRRYAKHDLVEVIINESSIQKFNQTLDTKKDYNIQAELAKFPSLAALFTNLELREGIGTVKPALGLTSNNKYKGEGKFDRKDEVSAKITATVVDVKPNGNLVLEARESIQSDKEITIMVLSGTCRADDISKSNTLTSSQLAGLNIRIEHEGDVKDTAEKGLIPRVIEAIFNF